MNQKHKIKGAALGFGLTGSVTAVLLILFMLCSFAFVMALLLDGSGELLNEIERQANLDLDALGVSFKTLILIGASFLIILACIQLTVTLTYLILLCRSITVPRRGKGFAITFLVFSAILLCLYGLFMMSGQTILVVFSGLMALTYLLILVSCILFLGNIKAERQAASMEATQSSPPIFPDMKE